MDTLHASAAEEAVRLRRCLNDLLGVIALPALWAGGDPRRIVGTLLDALVEMLDAAFVVARLNDFKGGPPTEMARVAEPWEGTLRIPEIGKAIDAALANASRSWPTGDVLSIGETKLSIACARVGLDGDLGTIIVGSARNDFPEQGEQLILDVAANEAALGLQQARLLSEQRRVVAELDERVARRTRELTAANELLHEEIEQHRLTERALRASELNFQLTVDSIPGMVHTMTATGGVEYVNHRILDYFGKTLEELNDWPTLIHPDDRSRVVEGWTHSVTTGEPFEVEHRVLAADGTYRWQHVRGLPLRDSSGNIVRWYNLLTDVDERKRAEGALRESERESRLIVDTIPGLVATLTPAGEVEFVNRKLLDYFGRTLEELKRWETHDTIHHEDLPRAIEVVTRSIASGEPYDFELRARRFDGVYRWFQSRAFPLRDTNGQIVRWYNLLIDIDERKGAEEELRRSEARKAAILDSALDCIVTIDHEGSITEFNPAAERTFDRRRDEVLGRQLADVIIPPALRERHRQGFARYLASGETRVIGKRIEMTAVRADGSEFPVELAITRIPLEGPPSFTGYLRDITERKRAEEESRRSEAFLAEAQQLSRIGSFSWLVATDEITWSEELYRIFEIESGVRVTLELIGTRVHPDDLSAFRDHVERSRRHGIDLQLEIRLQMPDRSIKYVHVVAHYREDSGQREYIGAVQDVTQRRLQEEALAKARSELAHVTRATSLGALTASIAHEVNQPLAGIITNASTCLRLLGADPPDVDGARETARRAIRDGNRASDVVTRLRALFSKREFSLEALDLNEATREVIALSLSDLQRHRVILQSELADDLPIIRGDRIQLQQVILNLLRNASDAMVDVHDRPRQLLIRTEQEDGDRVRVTVRDVGVGLPPQRMDALFDAFYTTKSGGMGIGLFVSRSIVERHQGRLWAQPNDGPGATVSFSIPLASNSIS